MVTLRHEKSSEAAAREALLDLAYGPARLSKPSQRLRMGRKPSAGLSFVALEDGAMIGTLRLWEVAVGASDKMLLLGPLAVHPDHRKRGVGAALMQRALRDAGRRGHRAVLLVGEPSYYGRFGFSNQQTGGLWLPGLDQRSRLLGHELVAGALDGARGMIRAPNRDKNTPLVAAVAGLYPVADPLAA